MRRTISGAAAALAALAVAPVGHAQEAQTYIYDVHGRLVSVTRSTGGTTRTTVYGLDDADNRTSRATTVSTSLAAAEGYPQDSAVQFHAEEADETVAEAPSQPTVQSPDRQAPGAPQ